jgi:hypothetical protein
MGVKDIIRQEVTKVRLNSHLAQFCELRVNLYKGIFQHLAMLPVLSCFELLQDPFAGENEPIALSFRRQLIGSQLRPGFVHRGSCFCLLVLN